MTAGSSSGVTDGAAALPVASRAAAEANGIPIEARLVDWAVVGVEPSIMGAGPVPAIRELLARTKLSVSDVDYFGINEAFAVVDLHAESLEKPNPIGYRAVHQDRRAVAPHHPG